MKDADTKIQPLFNSLLGGRVLNSVVGGLTLGSDGNFYGETVCGGLDFFPGNGTLFQLTPGENLTTLYAFGSGGANDGLYPAGGLIQAADGNFYGVTFNGGTNGDGTIFRLSVPFPPFFQSLAKTGETYSLTWSAVAGRTYQLQYTTNLSSSNWINLGGTNTATSGSMSECDLNYADAQRFYRVLLVQ